MSRPAPADAPDDGLDALRARVGAARIDERLRREGSPRTGSTIRRGLAPRLIRAALGLVGLHERGRRNALDIQIRTHQVRLPRLPAAFDGFRLLHLSDLHLGEDPALVTTLAERLRGLAHDLCVLTGDFRWGTRGPWQSAVDALARLRPWLGDPVYAVLGNHDSIRMAPALEALGLRVLLNESVCVRRGEACLTLAGIDDVHYFQTDDLQRALAGADPGGCTVLLSHAPDVYREAERAGISLMLSGHTHGGQICLPGGVPLITFSKAPRRLAAGAWRHGRLAGYTSVGCGTTLVDVRLNCPPEITLHTLRSGLA